jgi:sulfite dehydrogenase (quinone) subunit SoeB
MDAAEGVMKKCTLCVDRIYNENLPPRWTACPPACAPALRARGISAISPTRRARVSRLVAERGGFDLMPEQGTKPVNKYLPPRKRDHVTTPPANLATLCEPSTAGLGGFLGWLDRTLDSSGSARATV